MKTYTARCVGVSELFFGAPVFEKKGKNETHDQMRRAKTVEESALTDEQLKEHRLRTAVCGVLDVFTGSGTRQKLAAASTVATLVSPDPSKIVDLMKRK